MILDLIKNRYSARSFLDKPIEQEKIDYIIECAYNAPSKQSMYPWTLYVLSDSPKAQEFKEWLFWEDTWCVNGERARWEDRKNNDKKFNGQYRAPLLLMWAFRQPNMKKDKNKYQHFKTYRAGNLSDIRDITVSASFALLAAEELGLRTGFGGCNSWSYKDTVLGKEEVNVILSVGIGYAEVNDTVPMLEPIERKAKLQGYDTKNLSQTYPLEHHNIRQLKPTKEQIVKYIE